jgi:hypothetical protein
LRDALSRAAERVRPPRPEAAAEARPEPDQEESRPGHQPKGDGRAKPRSKAPAGSPPKARTTSRAKSKRPAAARKPAQKAQAKGETKGSAAERRLRRAVERFNESEQAKVVGGLIKSLGEPHASVRSVSTKPPRVAVTVAWELSWYRWEVSQDGSEVSVREVAKGNEVSELADEAKQWNAKVDGEGNVRLALAEARRAAAKATE